jgi:hypothetical protein
MTEADGLPLNRPDTVSAFGDTTTIRPRLFASVGIFPGAKSNVAPIFSSQKTWLPPRRGSGWH